MQSITEHIALKYRNAEQFGVMLGFDGFIDSVVRAVRQRDEADRPQYFETMSELGQYLIEKSGRNCSIELVEQTNKLGGNMPITALALGKLGFRLTSIGALGSQEVKPQFAGLTGKGNEAITLMEPGLSTAIEFRDGKVMLADVSCLDSMNWTRLVECVGKQRLLAMFDSNPLICLLNWSETKYATEIWQGFLEEIIPNARAASEQTIFIDLSDCSKKSVGDLRQAFSLMKAFQRHCKVVLGMNENELVTVGRKLLNRDGQDMTNTARQLYEYAGVDQLVVHLKDRAFAWSRDGFCQADSYPIERPVILTGGGDHFNAGYCSGQLLGLGIEESLQVGNAVASYYVKSGASPTPDQLVQHLSYFHTKGGYGV
ncbi:PfkB family carbohydrate kinase [Cohnella sp. 56]|uniref:PfkB family carbohydrate kinase n=1 Tax=Cohnella sp. 56 TaxID=3113722 RepID=UPI0030E8E439